MQLCQISGKKWVYLLHFSCIKAKSSCFCQNKKPPACVREARCSVQMSRSDRVGLIGVVHMVAVHALLLGIALVEELGCHLREHGVGQHVLFLRCPLGGFGLQLVHLRSQRVGKAAGDGLLVAQCKKYTIFMKKKQEK